MENYLIRLLLYDQLIVITSIPYYDYHKNSDFPWNQLLNSTFILSLAFSYDIHVPRICLEIIPF